MVSRAEDLDDDIVVGLRRLTGSYLGQCLIEVHDGEWVFEGERAFVRLAPDRDVDPFWMAESQLRYRDVYSVMTLFEAAPRIARVKVGGLYAIAEEQGGYVVVKVLAVDHIAVHLRQYSNQFDTLPDELDPATLDWSLDLEKFKSDDQKAIGIGHFPVSLDGFWDDDPMLVQVAEVEDDELDGYRTWLESA